MNSKELIKASFCYWKFSPSAHSIASYLYLSRIIFPFFISSEALREKVLSIISSRDMLSDFLLFFSLFSKLFKLVKENLLTVSFSSFVGEPSPSTTTTWLLCLSKSGSLEGLLFNSLFLDGGDTLNLLIKLVKLFPTFPVSATLSLLFCSSCGNGINWTACFLLLIYPLALGVMNVFKFLRLSPRLFRVDFSCFLVFKLKKLTLCVGETFRICLILPVYTYS